MDQETILRGVNSIYEAVMSQALIGIMGMDDGEPGAVMSINLGGVYALLAISTQLGKIEQHLATLNKTLVDGTLCGVVERAND